MSTDGDLWNRALLRGLDPAGTLLILRPAAATLVSAGRRAGVQAFRVRPALPPSGLYRVSPEGDALRLDGVDRAASAWVLPEEAGPRFPLPALAIVELSDPASHQD